MNDSQAIARVCEYIYEHLDEELSVDQLSHIAHFSKFHFHRLFTVYTGVSVIKYIRLMRLKKASYQLVYSQDSRVIDIAFEAGYENSESFSRAFKSIFSQTPSEFKKEPHWKSWVNNYRFSNTERTKIMQVDIVDFPLTKIAVLEHREDPDLLNYSISRFIEWRKQSKLSPVTTSNTYGLAYDDPKTTEAEKFRFDICGSVVAEVPDNPQGVINKEIPGGRCATVRHTGSHESMDATVHYLYGEWLSASGEQLRNFPCFFEYLNYFPEVPEHELKTDIYLPLE